MDFSTRDYHGKFIEVVINSNSATIQEDVTDLNGDILPGVIKGLEQTLYDLKTYRENREK